MIKKIATFNVNSIRSRMPIVEKFLADDAPDIACFQETKCRDEEFPASSFDALGYRVAFRGMKTYNGVAIASRDEPTSVTFGLGDGEDEERDECRIAFAAFGPLSVVCTYAPQGREIGTDEFAYKLRFFERVKRAFEKRFSPGDLVLWLGDLNVAPTDADLTNPKGKKDHVCVCADARAALEDVVSWGLVDVFRKHRPDAGEYTFFDYRVKDAFARNIGWRIDHLFATKKLADLSRDAYVARELRAMERPSDHTAVVASFDL